MKEIIYFNELCIILIVQELRKDFYKMEINIFILVTCLTGIVKMNIAVSAKLKVRSVTFLAFFII